MVNIAIEPPFVDFDPGSLNSPPIFDEALSDRNLTFNISNDVNIFEI